MIRLIPNTEFLNTTKNRFYSAVMIPNENGCMEWTKCLTSNGYGIMSINRKNYSAHRFSYELHYGKIPKGLKVLHKCDNPKCVAPDHLFLGSQKDNMVDMSSKNRAFMKKGNKHPFHKISEESIKEIKKMLFDGSTQKEIAKKFNVTQSTISHISIGRDFKDYSFTDIEIKELNEIIALKKKKLIYDTKRKLTDIQVNEIRKMLSKNMTCLSISKLFNVSRSTINNIKLSKTYLFEKEQHNNANSKTAKP